ncbi:DNA gyrase, A subunit domain protein, partial [Shigella flexneri 1235-66]
MTNKRRDDVFQVHDLRLTMVQCHHVDTERNLQLGL